MNQIDLRIGDVTQPMVKGGDPSQYIVIPHVVNNIGLFNAGVALAIKKRWSKAEEVYQKWFRESGSSRNLMLGRIYPALVEYGDYGYTIIMHMCAQTGVRSSHTPHPLNYEFLEQCMENVAWYINRLSNENLHLQSSIHCPKFGCGLAGGQWEEVEKLIQRIWIAKGIPVTVYVPKRTREER